MAFWMFSYIQFCKQSISTNTQVANTCTTNATQVTFVRFNKNRSQCPGGGIGRRKGLKIPRLHGRAGSIPAPGTIYYPYLTIRYSGYLKYF